MTKSKAQELIKQKHKEHSRLRREADLLLSQAHRAKARADVALAEMNEAMSQLCLNLPTGHSFDIWGDGTAKPVEQCSPPGAT